MTLEKYQLNLVSFLLLALLNKTASAQNIESENNKSEGILYGAHLSMATAYQSCDVLKLPPMNAKSNEVKGIKIDGKHPNGIGDRFTISDLPLLLKTHYYWSLPTQVYEGCRAQKNRPLIYDYGGKPWTTTQNEKVLDFFKDAGSGTDVLGIDCSGFVFSTLAAAGLKLSARQELTAKLVNKYNANSFKEPTKNGLDCFEVVTSKHRQPLQAGDIIASSYHVAIVDSVGPDPLGISKISYRWGCHFMDTSDFNFTLIQSAPYKGGIGIHRVNGNDYVDDNFFFSLGMSIYATAACQNWFDQNNLSSKSEEEDANEPAISELKFFGLFGPFTRVIRHKETPECKTEALKLSAQECVEMCPDL